MSINDIAVDEGVGTATFTVSLSAISGRDVTVDYATNGVGTATAGADYTAVSATTITIPAGSLSNTADVDVDILEDALDEDDETFEVVLSTPTNATIADGTGVGTIQDNDGN